MAVTNPLIASKPDRGSVRARVKMVAQLRETACKPDKVDLLDLSREGFRFSHHRSFHVGTQLWITLPGMGSLLAEVKWSDGIRTGCRFQDPLHEAVLARVLGS